MRSRYTANALDMQEYLLRTWHPSTRPTELMPTAGLRWVGLTIHRTDAGGSDEHSGTVVFTAHFRERGRPGALHETSRFIREREQWFYLDGDIH